MEKEKIKDAVVENIVNQFVERSNVGVEKYGKTLDQNNTDDFLQHLKEELMDATLYVQKVQDLKKENGLDCSQVTRVEIIDQNGRVYTEYDVNNVEVHMQDNNRTMKIFLTNNRKKVE